jgi:hypothetical protein
MTASNTLCRARRQHHAHDQDAKPDACLPVDEAPMTNICKFHSVPSQSMKQVDDVVPVPRYSVIVNDNPSTVRVTKVNLDMLSLKSRFHTSKKLTRVGV